MQSIEKQIKEKFTEKKRGTLFFPEDFSQIGSSEAVRLALHRLEKQNFIKRVAQGIYVRPELDALIGELTPTTEAVAQAIAKRDKIRIVPTGAYAQNALGLSTQLPMKVVFLTDGAPRIIQVGKRTIKFKKTTPKNLMAKGQISRLVIQALKDIGKDKATEKEVVKIIELLKEEDKKHLIHDLQLAPVWIKKIMQKAL